MKRHSSLVPLSRDHHGALMLAQLIKKDAPAYTGLPTTTEGKAKYALEFYEAHLVKHFAQEEQMLRSVTRTHPSLELPSAEIFSEHKQLHELFALMNTVPDKEAVLNQAGHALEAHIRKEERILFPLVEKNCSEEELQQLAALFTGE
jgi:hemerythrin-like domain-containing protein